MGTIYRKVRCWRKGFIGKYTFFNLFWDGTQSRGSETPYRLKSNLPGIKNDLGLFKTREEGKNQAESVLKLWLKNTGLKGRDE